MGKERNETCICNRFGAVREQYFFAAEPVEAKEKKSVCVLSYIGEYFGLKKIGIMVFGNEYSSVPITDWKIDDQVFAATQKTLGEKFNLKRIGIPADAFQSVDEPGGLFRDRETEAKDSIRKLIGEQSCDYILFISPGVSQFGSSNQFIGGLGVVEAESIFNDYRAVYAIALARIYDGKNFELLSRARLNSGQNLFQDPIQGPYEQIEFKTHPSLQAVAGDPKTREIVSALLDKALKTGLPEHFDVGQITQSARPAPGKGKDDWAPF